MKSDLKISTLQLISLISMTLGPVTGTYSPSIMAQIAGQDMWMSLLISVAIIVLSSAYFCWLAKQFPDQTLIQFSISILGRYLGKTIGFLYILYFFFMTTIYISILSTTFKTLFFINTPVLIFVLMVTIGCTYASYAGIESIARISMLWAFVFYFVELVLLSVTVLPLSDFGNYLPMREAPWSNILYASLFAFYPQSLIILITMMYPKIHHKGNSINKRIVIGLLLLSMLTVLLNIIEIALFSAKQLSLFLYPPVELISMVRLGEFFERTEIFFVVGWGIVMQIGSMSLFTFAIEAFMQWYQSPKPVFQVPAALFVTIFSITFFPNTNKLIHFLFGYGVYVSLLFQLGIPLLLGVILLYKRLFRIEG